jgi:hypothetical protein
MNHVETGTWAKALLLKIHVITGWVIPGNELLNILVDQFEKKLKEDYGHFNVEEIEYAFRKHGTAVKDWGKQMNLSLIDEVLIPYLHIRHEASENERKRNFRAPEQRIFTDEEIQNERREHIELAFQAMKAGKMPIIHVYFAEVLEADGHLKENEKVADFFVRVLGQNLPNIYVKA